MHEGNSGERGGGGGQEEGHGRVKHLVLQILTSVTSPHCSKCCRSLSSLRCLGSPLTQSRDEPLIPLVGFVAAACRLCTRCFPVGRHELGFRLDQFRRMKMLLLLRLPLRSPLPLLVYFTCPLVRRQTAVFSFERFLTPGFQRNRSHSQPFLCGNREERGAWRDAVGIVGLHAKHTRRMEEEMMHRECWRPYLVEANLISKFSRAVDRGREGGEVEGGEEGGSEI